MTDSMAPKLLIASVILLWAGPLRSGERAPDFHLPDVHGKCFALADVKSKVIVINFWAFWCDTWKDELPLLSELAAQQEQKDFTLIAVSVDGKRVEQFLDRTGGRTSFPVLLDEGEMISRAYGIAHVPTMVILDRQRRVHYRQKGVPRLPTLLREIREAAKP